MGSPVTKLFETYELLEIILLHLTTRNLFAVRRVSRLWKALIDDSQPLQRRMFLLPSATPVRPSIDDISLEVPIPSWPSFYRGILHINPTVAFRHEVYRNAREHGATSSKIEGHFVLCRSYENNILCHYLELAWSDLRNKDPDRFGFHASCHDMFLTQPPVTAVEYRTSPNIAYSFDSEAVCTLYNPRGITLGNVWAGMARAREDFEKEPVETTERRRHDVLHFRMSLPLENETRKRLYESCTFPFEESREMPCDCVKVLFAPPEPESRSRS